MFFPIADHNYTARSDSFFSFSFTFSLKIELISAWSFMSRIKAGVDYYAEAHALHSVDTSRAKDGVWLVKVPKYLAELWQKAGPDGVVGKVVIASSAAHAPTGDGKRPASQVTLVTDSELLTAAGETGDLIPKVCPHFWSGCSLCTNILHLVWKRLFPSEGGLSLISLGVLFGLNVSFFVRRFSHLPLNLVLLRLSYDDGVFLFTNNFLSKAAAFIRFSAWSSRLGVCHSFLGVFKLVKKRACGLSVYHSKKVSVSILRCATDHFGSSVSLGLLPHLTYCDLMLFFFAPSLRVMVSGLFLSRVMSTSNHGTCSFHYIHMWSMSGKEVWIPLVATTRQLAIVFVVSTTDFTVTLCDFMSP